MRWPVFAIMGYLLLVLDTGLSTLLAVNGISPSLTLILLAFVALWANPMAAAWAALALGLAVDLNTPIQTAHLATDAVLIGPAALAYLTGAYVTVQLRGMLFRDSPLAVAVLVLVAGAFVNLVIVAMLTLRGLPWPIAEPLHGWSAADQLVARFFGLLYTAAVAVPAGYLLIRTQGLWGFHPHLGKGPAHHQARR